MRLDAAIFTNKSLVEITQTAMAFAQKSSDLRAELKEADRMLLTQDEKLGVLKITQDHAGAHISQLEDSLKGARKQVIEAEARAEEGRKRADAAEAALRANNSAMTETKTYRKKSRS